MPCFFRSETIQFSGSMILKHTQMSSLFGGQFQVDETWFITTRGLQKKKHKSVSQKLKIHKMGMDHIFLRHLKKLWFSYHPSGFWRNQFWPIPNYRLWLNQQKIMDCTRWAIVLGWFSIVSTKKGCPKSINKCECVCVWLWFWTLRIPAIIPFFRDPEYKDHNWDIWDTYG